MNGTAKTKARRPYPVALDDDGRPSIKIDVDLDRVVTQAIEALANDPETYQRDFRLVHVVRGDGEHTGSPMIRAMSTATIRVRLSAAAAWLKYDARAKGLVAAIPTDPVVKGVEGAGTYPRVRPLVGIAEAPFPRRDGTIVQAPGYDPTTAYLYVPSAEFPRVPDEPTIEDARRALDEVLEIVVDFPFASPAHRSAWVALLLTLFARPAIDGPVPAFGINATTRGTGKTLLLDAAAVVFTGREAHKRPFPGDDDELRKTLTGAIRDGDRLTAFDNVRRPVEGPSLEALITSCAYRDRELGSNDSISGVNTTVVTFTGNGLAYAGDMTRRVLPIDLEADCEKPEDRDGFRHANLLAWVTAERPRLVAAVLTVIRAWYAAGRPSMGVRPLGSFTAWSQIVPPILRWLGEPCPLETRQAIDTSDDARNALAVLLDGWEQMQGDGALTAKQVVRVLYPPSTFGEPPPEPAYYDEMRAAVEALTGQQKPSAVKLAGTIRTNKGRICEGRRFAAVKGRAGVVSWRAERVSNRDGGVGGVGGVSLAVRVKLSERQSQAPEENYPTNPTNPTTEDALDDFAAYYDPEVA